MAFLALPTRGSGPTFQTGISPSERAILNLRVLIMYKGTAAFRASLDLQHVVKLKLKIKVTDTSYIAAYMSHTRDQQRFTIPEVAADRGRKRK